MSTPPARSRHRSAPAAAGFAPADLLLLVALSSMWGLSFLFIELALRDLGPLWIVTGRTVIGGALLLSVVLVRGGLPRGGGLWLRLLALGIVNNALPWAAIAWAQQRLPSGLTGLLMAIVPTTTLLVAAAVGLERITPRRLLGLLLAMAGVAVIVGGDIEQPGRVVAVLAVVLATLGYAMGAVFAKSQLSGLAPPLAIATGQVVSAAAVTLPVAWFVEGTPQLSGLAPTTLLAMTLLGAFGTGLAFLVFYTLVARVGATNATLTTYLIPIVAVVAGTWLLDERLGVSAMIGGGLILVGIWLAQHVASPPRPSGDT
ncbi:MAG: DMT family transporter [Nitriliruptoraceae bacterium]